MTTSPGWTEWADFIADDEWYSYQRVLKEAHFHGIPFALGGGFATAIHTGLWQDTRDLDVYILPSDSSRMIELTRLLGFIDVNNKLPYDHSWTYRGTDGQVIVEAIWSMRNGRAHVDSEWLDRSEKATIRSTQVKVAPVEEMIWHKLYVLMKERCDWPDILNYFYFRAEALDWDHLLKRLGEDAPLLAAVLSVFSWVSPDRTETVPGWVWQHLGLQIPSPGSSDKALRRASFLSPHRWYAPMAEDSKLERSR